MRGEKTGASAKTKFATGVALTAGAVLAIAIGCSRSEAAPSRKAEPTPAVPAVAAVPAGGSEVTPAASKVDGKNFTLEMVPQGECKAGAECRVVIRLDALGEYHINKEYPYKFTAKADTEVEFLGSDAAMKNVFSKANGDFKTEGETKATMTVKFKPAKAGPVGLSGTYKMSVCSAQNCQLESQQLSLSIVAK